MPDTLDPQWTTPVPSGRVTNPTGAVTARDRTFNRLLYPVLSNAITHRLRYVSFWCWVLANTDDLSSSEEVGYEKLFLFASQAHDCDTDATLGDAGLVGATREVERLPPNHPRYGDDTVNVNEFYTPELDPVPLSDKYTKLTKSNDSGFETYYRNWLLRLFLIQDHSTLTSIGAGLAEAYADSHSVTWDRLETAVENDAAPQQLITDLSSGGCVCSLSDQERQLLRRTWFGLINRATTYDELALSNTPDGDVRRVQITSFLGASEDTAESNDESDDQLAEALSESEESIETGLERYVRYGYDVSMRASQLLFLHSARALSDGTAVCAGGTHPLRESQVLWRFHIQSEQFAWALGTVLGIFLDALRELQPCRVGDVLNVLTTHPGFTAAVEDALGDFETVTTSGTATTFDEVKLGILYGDNTTNEQEIRSTSESTSCPATWHGLTDALATKTPPTPFARTALSEWQLQRRLTQARTNTAHPVAERTARACGYAAVLLARFQTRFPEYYAQETLAPYRSWFAQTVTYSNEPPNLRMLWHLSDRLPVDQSNPIPTVTRTLLEQTVLVPYLDRLYNRMESGQIPQHFTVDGTGRLRFERGYELRSLSQLKYRRICDTLFELNLITSNDYKEFTVTADAEQLLDHVLQGASG